MALIGSNNKVWIKGDDSLWRVATTAQLQEMAAASSLIVVSESNTTEADKKASNITDSTEATKLSNGAVAAISVVTTFVFCTLIACVIFVWCSVGKRRKNKKITSYENLSVNNSAVSELAPSEHSTMT